MPLLEQPFLGGAFNWAPIFGIQLYFWLMIFGLFIIVGSEIFWRFTFWEPMNPFHGLYEAFTNGSKAAMVGDLNLDWALMSEAKATLIFDSDYYKFAIEEMGWWIKFRAWLYKPDFSAAIAAELEGKAEEPTLITIGKIPTHILIDIQHWTWKNSNEQKAIKKAAEEWNNNHPEDQVHRFRTFVQYVRNGNITCPEGVKLEQVIPWPRIDAAFPVVRSDAAWAGFVRQIAEEMHAQSSGDLNKWAVYVLVFAAAVVVLMFVTKWFFTKTPV